MLNSSYKICGRQSTSLSKMWIRGSNCLKIIAILCTSKCLPSETYHKRHLQAHLKTVCWFSSRFMKPTFHLLDKTTNEEHLRKISLTIRTNISFSWEKTRRKCSKFLTKKVPRKLNTASPCLSKKKESTTCLILKTISLNKKPNLKSNCERKMKQFEIKNCKTPRRINDEIKIFHRLNKDWKFHYSIFCQ